MFQQVRGKVMKCTCSQPRRGFLHIRTWLDITVLSAEGKRVKLPANTHWSSTYITSNWNENLNLVKVDLALGGFLHGCIGDEPCSAGRRSWSCWHWSGMWTPARASLITPITSSFSGGGGCIIIFCLSSCHLGGLSLWLASRSHCWTMVRESACRIWHSSSKILQKGRNPFGMHHIWPGCFSDSACVRVLVPVFLKAVFLTDANGA